MNRLQWVLGLFNQSSFHLSLNRFDCWPFEKVILINSFVLIIMRQRRGKNSRNIGHSHSVHLYFIYKLWERNYFNTIGMILPIMEKNISIYKWSSLIIYVFLCILVLDFRFLLVHVKQCLYKTEIIHFHPNFITEKSATLTITQSSEHLRPHTVCI